MFYKIIFFFCLTDTVLSLPFEKTNPICGYESCHSIDENKINVHLVPHSHDDVGWLKTVDQYYFGSQSDIQKAGVQYIITSAVEALKRNPDRRFIQVETAFLWKWWTRQNEQLKQKFLDLINNGQLEIINGGWSMNDEAATNYQSTIDQFTWGFRFLNDTLGECGRPKVGWQIDPFGHSREHASLLSQFGFDGLFIGRLDYRDKTQRQNDRRNDFLWQTSQNLENSTLFTSIFPEFYVSPTGYCWDIICDDAAINDDPQSPDYNLKEKVDDFAAKIQKYSTYYPTNNVLVPMGGDFQYQAAHTYFENIDRLIKGFQDHKEINVIYSTPSCYIKAVNTALKALNLTIKSDDFFPYASDPHAFWTGYFTSRPNSKRFERLGNNILQVAKQLVSFAKTAGNDYEENLKYLREAMGVMQHHDAITGTEKAAVTKDYVRILTRGIKEAEKPLPNIIGNLLAKNSDNADLPLKLCILSNVSICEDSLNERFVVTVYNPLSRIVDHFVRISVDDGVFTITGPEGDEIYDILEPISKFDYIPENGKGNKELVFLAKNIPPLGIKCYFIEKTDKKFVKNTKIDDSNYFGNDKTGFAIDPETNRLKSITMNGMTLNVTQEFLYYFSANGTNEDFDARASGAYIFRPLQTTIDPETVSNGKLDGTATKGQLLDEFKQIINEHIVQIIRVYKDSSHNYIEFDWLIGDLDVDEENLIGKEFITRFTINSFNNNGTFYTDSNGRELLERIINKRADYVYDPEEEPISSNYYPITSHILIRDKERKVEFAVLNDRAQGGTSLKDGLLELMIHRRILRDDAFGVEEALNEMEYNKGVYVRGQHYVLFGSCEAGESVRAEARVLALKKRLAPVVLIANATDQTLTNLEKTLDFTFSGIVDSLPDNLNILTLEPWKDDTLLLRLEHLLENEEDENLSKPMTIDLTKLFTLFEIDNIVETLLGANQLLQDYINQNKFVWNSISNEKKVGENGDSFEITLNPMEIRTFIITTKRRDDQTDDGISFKSLPLMVVLNVLLIILINK